MTHGNGEECQQVQVIQDLRTEVATLQRQVRSVEAMAPNFDALLPELTGLRHDLVGHRDKLESHGNIMTQCVTKLGFVEAEVKDLRVWQKDVLGEGNRRLSTRAGQKRGAFYTFLGALAVALVSGVLGLVVSFYLGSHHASEVRVPAKMDVGQSSRDGQTVGGGNTSRPAP